jgi:ADP-heptose:LPS heptosyltransferase/polysaccharide pyruvyl transferase WcaK-like protein
MRLVVSSPDGLGDFILREPLLSSLQEAGHEILILCRPAVRPAARWVAPQAATIEISIDPYQPFAIDPANSLEPLWREVIAWDPNGLVIAPSQRTIFDEALMSRWTSGPIWGLDGGRYPSSVETAQTLGLATPRHWPQVPNEMPDLERNRLLAEAILGVEVSGRAPRLSATDTIRADAPSLLPAHGFGGEPYWVACVGEDERNAERNWPIDRWAELIRHAIDEHGWRVLLIGTTSEQAASLRVLERVDRPLTQVRSWSGDADDFDTLARLVAESVGYLGRDTGAMHLSAALGKPVFAVFGGGTWPRFLPRSTHGVAVTLETPCQGCGWYCHLSKPYCIKAIPPVPVRQLLDESVRGGMPPLRVVSLPRPATLAIQMEREAAQRARDDHYRSALAHWERTQQKTPRPAESYATRTSVHLGFPFYGAGNLGDDLMVDGFLQWLAESNQSLGISASISGSIESQARRFPQIYWTSATIENRVRHISACDAYLGLGGTPFQNDSGPWMLDYLAADLELCQRYDKPLYLLGVGVGNESALDDPRARRVIDYASKIWTRDERSARLLRARFATDKIVSGADLAHLSLSRMSLSCGPGSQTGWIVHFEDQRLFSLPVLTELLADVELAPHRWLVQEVRPLAGSEQETLGRLSPAAREHLEVDTPDYAQALSAAELVSAWTIPSTLVSSRYHGLMVGAWAGARLLAVERNDKLAGAAESLGCASVPSLTDAKQWRAGWGCARPVDRRKLQYLAQLAERSCQQFVTMLLQEGMHRLRSRPTDQEIRIFPEAFEGNGWYDTEFDGETSFRWMGERSEATLIIKRRDPGKIGEFRCTIPHAIEPALVDEVELRFNGEPAIATIRRVAHGWEMVAVIEPKEKQASAQLEVEWRVPRTLRPVDLNPNTEDDRPLGIAVGFVSFRTQAA